MKKLIVLLVMVALSATAAQAVAIFSDNFDSYTNLADLTTVSDWADAGNAPSYSRVRAEYGPGKVGGDYAIAPGDSTAGQSGVYIATGAGLSGAALTFEASMIAYGGSEAQIALMPTTTTVMNASNRWTAAASVLCIRLMGDGYMDWRSTNSGAGSVGHLSATGLSAGQWYDFRATLTGGTGVVNATLEYKLSSASTWTTHGTIVTDSSWNAGNVGIAGKVSGAVDNITLVPEPATMALLGLGSLVMLRRKRV